MPPGIYPCFLQSVAAPAERIAAAYRRCVRAICFDQARILRRLPMNVGRGYAAARLCLQRRSEIQTVRLGTLEARSISPPLCPHNVSDEADRGDGDIPAQDFQNVAEAAAVGSGGSGGGHLCVIICGGRGGTGLAGQLGVSGFGSGDAIRVLFSQKTPYSHPGLSAFLFQMRWWNPIVNTQGFLNLPFVAVQVVIAERPPGIEFLIGQRGVGCRVNFIFAAHHLRARRRWVGLAARYPRICRLEPVATGRRKG